MRTIREQSPSVGRWIAVAAACALLLGCGFRFNPKNFARIENGMSEDQVTRILGQPSSVSSGSLPVINITGTEYVYQRGDSRASIAFVNGKVVFKEATFGEKR